MRNKMPLCYMTVDLLVPSFLSQKIGKGGNECT